MILAQLTEVARRSRAASCHRCAQELFAIGVTGEAGYEHLITRGTGTSGISGDSEFMVVSLQILVVAAHHGPRGTPSRHYGWTSSYARSEQRTAARRMR